MADLASSLAAPYWEAARERRLVIQWCASCDRYSHPPVPECHACRSTDLVWQDVSGRGVIHAAVAVRSAVSPGFGDKIPYAGIAVELVEQPGLIVVAHLVGSPFDEARVGGEVEVDFEQLPDGRAGPQFRLRRRPGTR